jgi:hypothetical protein
LISASTGIGQVGNAVAQLDVATQQNAALVEEGAAVADNLEHQAVLRTSIVRKFVLAHVGSPQQPLLDGTVSMSSGFPILSQVIYACFKRGR